MTSSENLRQPPADPPIANRLGLADLAARLVPEVAITVVYSLAELNQTLYGGDKSDLVIFDLPVPAGLSLTVFESLLAARGAAPVIVYADCMDLDLMVAIFDAGARGLVPRDIDPELLLAAVRYVVRGGTYLPIQLLRLLRQRTAAGLRRRDDDWNLSPRQQAVLSHVKRGMSNKQIAYELGVTEGTVKLHVHAILKALGVSNRTAAALLAAGEAAD